MEQILNSSSSAAMTEKRYWPWWLRGWSGKALILVGFVVLVGVAITWIRYARRHQASTYGVADPSSAVLRVENRTHDFAITRVTLRAAEEDPAEKVVLNEVSNGANAMLKVVPGTYFVTVSYIEIKQVEFGRPSGTLSTSFTVLPGKAIIMCLQGGRSSPESLMSFPPGLALK